MPSTDLPIIDKEGKGYILNIEEEKRIVNDFSFDFCINSSVIFVKVAVNAHYRRAERRKRYVETS